jgi:plasmid stabilization system protein ParE
MKRRYILAPEAARDLVQIWRYLKKESNWETADRVESVIRSAEKTHKIGNLRDFVSHHQPQEGATPPGTALPWRCAG